MRRKKRLQKTQFTLLMGILALLAIALSFRGFDLAAGGFTVPFQNAPPVQQAVSSTLPAVAIISLALVAVFLASIYLAYRWFA